MTEFPSDVSGPLRVAYLIAGEIARQNGDQRPYAEDRGDGRVFISGIVDLVAVVQGVLAAAPEPKPLWWNDGPIRDAAACAALEVLDRHGYSLPGIADLCAGAVLQVAHRAGYGPIRSVSEVEIGRAHV